MTGQIATTDEPVLQLADLLSHAANGDVSAFSALHARTRAKMRKTAFEAGASVGDVDDILQDGYLKIWRNAGNYDRSRAAPITWMATIMRNTALDALRARRMPTCEIDEALSLPIAADWSADDEFDYEQARTTALVALARLPEDRRQLITLAYMSDESRAALSERYGVPVGTIKTWLHRTLQSVRKECLAAAPGLAAMPA